MRCPRCNGFISTRHQAIGERVIRLDYVSCMNCGHILAQRERVESGRSIDLATLRNTQPEKPPCKVDGCDRVMVSRGRCGIHANIVLRLGTRYAGRVEFAKGQVVELLDRVELSTGRIVRTGELLMVIGIRRGHALTSDHDFFLVQTTDTKAPMVEFDVDAELLSAQRERGVC